MKDLLFKEVYQFLKRHLQSTKPLVLGLSGGPDSMALFYLLLEAKDFFSFDLHVATLDHGWREESAGELEQLRKLCQEQNVTFHSDTLDKLQKLSNVENELREKRFEFFKKVYSKVDAQALVLGHQADDLAETVFKRIMEGAHFLSINSLKEVSVYSNMTIWRPLLQVTKKQIYEWLDKRHIHYFEDPTNKDTQYLRARLREQIFPTLEEKFGKSAVSNLVKLALAIQDIEDYLGKKTASMKQAIEPYEKGVAWQTPSSIEKIEFESVIKEMGKRVSGVIPSSTLKDLWEAYDLNKSNKEYIIKDGKFFIVNRKIFLELI